MKKRLTMRTKILLIAFVINAVCTVAFTFTACRMQRRAFLDGVDNKLEAVAAAVPELISADFHDRAQGPDSIQTEEYMSILKRLSDYANGIGIKYVYTYVKFDGRFRVASSSATKEELSVGGETAYFTEYEQPPFAMIDAWQTKAVRYAEYEDEWGFFRSIFVPVETAKGARYIIGADVPLDFVEGELRRGMIINAGLGVVIFLLVWFFSYVIISHILRPIGRLASYIHLLSDRDFIFSEEQRVELNLMVASYKDEVGQLASAFYGMAGKLVEYLRNLKETTSAKERIESELKIAHDIQMSFLKKHYPFFPDRQEFDLHATLVPAKEVGGDLYDFYMLDDEHLFFYVGDVSDKGVPAALMMAVTITLMKRAGHEAGNRPAEILRRVNEELSKENERLLFVTMFCGVLNVRTGELWYSNAGHNPPLIIGENKACRSLRLPPGIVLGVMPGARYVEVESKLKPGETMVVCTDGVTEAMNTEREIYTEDRLEATLESLDNSETTKVTGAIMRSVAEYAGAEPQSDDITILTLRYKGCV